MAYKEIFSQDYQELTVDVCLVCGRYFAEGKWKPFENLSSVVSKQFDKYVKQYMHALISFTTQIPPETKRQVDSDEYLSQTLGKGSLRIEIEVLTKELTFTLPVLLRKQQCNLCAKRGTDYFEAIVQLRNIPQEVRKDFLDQLKNQYQPKGVYINKTIEHKNGVDYYLTKKNYAKRMVLDLQKRYGGVVGYHPQLFSQDSQTSKPLYRLTVIYRYPQFNVGDVIQDKFGHDIRVISIGKTVFGRRVSDETKQDLSYDELDPRYI
jgi:nonsense-mediated mRNA decay protein 3